MAATDEAEKAAPTMEELDGALRTALGKAITGVADVAMYTDALAKLRATMRADRTAACHDAESEARAATHRASVAAQERKGGGNRG